MMPVFALGMFVFLPLPVALPLYLAATTISFFVYAKILHALRTPIRTGHEGMIGQEALVVSELTPTGLISYRGELWKALSKEAFLPGERVQITSVEGLLATVGKADER